MTDEDQFPSEDAAKTARMRPRNAFVLVVHEPGDDGKGSWQPLNDEYIVRDVENAFDALDWLTREALACVVCVIGDSLSGADFHALVSRISDEQARRVVFLSAPGHADVAFLEQRGCHWLAMPVGAEELLALVRAVSSR